MNKKYLVIEIINERANNATIHETMESALSRFENLVTENYDEDCDESMDEILEDMVYDDKNGYVCQVIEVK